MSFWSTLAKIGGGIGSAIPGIGPLLGIGMGALGGALNGRESARTGKSSNTFDNTSTSMQTESPEYAGMGGLLRDFITKRLGAPVPMAGYQAQGLSNINDTSNLIQQSIKNKLTSSGLGGSPVEGNALANAELSRGSQAAGFLNQLPLVERDLQNQDFTQALQLFSQRPMGQTVTSKGNNSGTFTQPGSMLGGAFGDAASMLGFLAGQGMLGGKKGRGDINPF